MTQTNKPDRTTGIDTITLQEWIARPDSPRIIDVRTPGEFHTAHIPGSYNVPLDLLTEHRQEFAAYLDDPAVLVCRSGARADQAEQALDSTSASSSAQLHVLRGGLSAWETNGGEVTRGAQKWDLERQVRLVAGSIVLVAVLLSLLVPWTIWIAGAIGAGLTVAALTNSCLMGMLLAKLSYNRQSSPDIRTVLSDLRST